MKSALEKITARAKQLQRDYPNTAWKNLIKRASKELRNEGKIGKVKTRTTVKRKTTVSGFGKKKKSQPSAFTQRIDAGMTVSAAKHFVKKDIEGKMTRQMILRDFGANKTIKKAARKEYARLKKEYSKFL